MKSSAPIQFDKAWFEGGDRGSPWHRYQLIWYKVPPKLKVLIPPIFGAIVNMRNCQKPLSTTSIFHEANGQDKTTPEQITVAFMSLPALLKVKICFRNAKQIH